MPRIVMIDDLGSRVGSFPILGMMFWAYGTPESLRPAFKTNPTLIVEAPMF